MSLWTSLAHSGVPVDSTPEAIRWPAFSPAAAGTAADIVQARTVEEPGAQRGAVEEELASAHQETTLLLATRRAGPRVGVKREDCAFWVGLGLLPGAR
eukprot:3214798-Prymnesium_polylepis.1